MGINGFEISFRGLSHKDFSLLEKWYKMTDYFGYATGFKDFSEIRQRLLEANPPSSIISMIDRGHSSDTIGFIYGEVKYIERNTILWINIFIIEPAYQNKGIGTCAINKLLYLAQQKFGPLTCIAAVSDKNVNGLSFWQKAGFTRSYNMEESLSQFGTSHVAIMKRTVK